MTDENYRNPKYITHQFYNGSKPIGANITVTGGVLNYLANKRPVSSLRKTKEGYTWLYKDEPIEPGQIIKDGDVFITVSDDNKNVSFDGPVTYDHYNNLSGITISGLGD